MIEVYTSNPLDMLCNIFWSHQLHGRKCKLWVH